MMPAVDQERLARAIVAALGGKWHGSQGLCPCPTHEDKNPSLSVRAGETSILVHCFAGCDGKTVMRALRANGLLDGSGSTPEPYRPASTTRDNRALARKLWQGAIPTRGTLAERYLRARGISISSPALRFHRSTQAGSRSEGMMRPAMIGAVTDGQGELVAVQRLFLAPPGRKAAMDSPRRALGPVTAGLVRLAPIRDDGRLGIAEGIETALSATQIHGIPCWATLGTELFGMQPLPDEVRELVLFVDNGTGGNRAEHLAQRWEAPGRTTRTVRPPEGFGDWNDVLQCGERRSGEERGGGEGGGEPGE